LNLAAGEDKGSSFLFLADAGVAGMLRRVFVASPRMRFWGSLVAMAQCWAAETAKLVEIYTMLTLKLQTFAGTDIGPGPNSRH
jgi:hypothetical protein